MKIITIIVSLILIGEVHAQTLKEIQSLALEKNPHILQAYAEFEAALSRSAQAAKMPDPTLSAGVFILPVETRVGPQQAKIGLSQMFPWFGTLKASGNVATLEAESKFHRYEDLRASVIKEVSTAYLRLHRNRELRSIEDELIRLLSSLEDITRTRYEQSLGSLADLYRVQLSLEKARSERRVLVDEETGLLAHINILLEREVSTAVPTDTTLLFPELTTFGDSVSLHDHPLQKASEVMRDAQMEREREAKLRGLPRIGVGMDYILVGERSGTSLPDIGRDALIPMVSVSLPIYRKGIRAAQEEARHLQDAYEAESDAVINDLKADQQRLEAILYSSATRYRSAQVQNKLSQDLIDLLRSSYEAGAAPFEELLREEVNRMRIKRDELNAIVDHHTALVKLNYLKTTSANYE